MSEDHMKIEVENSKLVISIGTSLLCHAIKHGPYFQGMEDEPVITDEAAFVEAIRQELEAEDEEGTNLIHQAIDQAAENAIENGCEGIEFNE